VSDDVLTGTIDEIAAKAERILVAIVPSAWCQAQEWDSRIDCAVIQPDGRMAAEMVSLKEATKTRIKATAQRLLQRHKGIQVPLQNELLPPKFLGLGRDMKSWRLRPSEYEQLALLGSLTEVGPAKPVGYLPLYTIRDLAQLTPESVAASATARGLAAALFGPSECCIKSGALYVYHREALAILLQEKAATVCAAGLPIDPDRFVARIASIWFEPDHPLYPVIVAAFGAGS
jgi:hypothetical protein